MRRTATATQRRKKFAYQQANPLLPTNRSKQKQRAFDAATEYFKSYNTPLTKTLRDVFGVEFFARAALWLDPLSQFRNAAGIIAYENRLREKVGFKHNGSTRAIVHYIGTDNQDLETSFDPVPRYVVEDSVEVQDVVENNNTTEWNSYMWDSTNSSRGWENSWASDEKYDRNIPSFGTMRLHHVKSEDYLTPNLVYRTEVVEAHYSHNNYGFYELNSFHFQLSVDGSCTSPSGSIFVEDIEDFALSFMNENLQFVLPGALASKRSFNLAYQIAELKDLPRLLRDIGNFQHLLESYIKRPLQKLAELDKDIASLNLSWEFGVKSLISAHKGLMELPEKATKRLNYLIERSGKISSGRSSKKWLNFEVDQDLPTFEFLLPPWIEASKQTVERQFDIELRCVVEQTIQFPKLAVPSISNTDYLKLIGAVPRVEDFYNILPFTWLFDWFGGLGAYIDIMDAVHSDRQIINYGFLTVVFTEVLTHTAELKVTSTYLRTRTGLNPGDPLIVEEYKETVKAMPYLKTYTRKYQQRVDLGSLEGVKSFGFFQTNLSDFQSKILGSLTSQRL